MIRKLVPLTIAFLFITSFAFAGEGYETYTIQKGDTLNKIADAQLKDASLLSRLISYNISQKVITSHRDLKVGVELRIPYSLSKKRIAKMTMKVGNVVVKRNANGSQEDAQKGTTLLQQDKIITAHGSKAEIELDEGSVVRVGPKTEFDLKDYAYNQGNRNTNLDLKQGSMSMKVTKLTGSADFKVSTVTAVAGVRGTYFFVNYDPESDKVDIAVYKGEVVVGQDTKDENNETVKTEPVKVTAGHAVTVSNDGNPPKVIKIPEKIEWAD